MDSKLLALAHIAAACSLQPAPFHRGGHHRYNYCLTENCHFPILGLSASLQVGAALQ